MIFTRQELSGCAISAMFMCVFSYGASLLLQSFAEHMMEVREEIPWSVMTSILILVHF
jgi:hypothetical protein